MPEYLPDILNRLLIIILLILTNASFVAFEYALIGIRETRIEHLIKQGNKAAKIVKEQLKDIEKYIATVQLGVTGASIGLGWVGESTIATILYPAFKNLPGLNGLIATHAISSMSAFIFVTLILIVLGELVPKSVALRYPENIILSTSRIMEVISKIFAPFIYFLNKTSMAILKPFNIEPARGIHLVHSVEELDMLVDTSYKEGVVTETEKDLVHNVFKFSSLIARQVMIPRLDMVCIPSNINLDELGKFLLENHYTRYPVYEGDLDHILGTVHLKDMVSFIEKQADFDIKKIVKKVMMIPETVTIDNLLIEFKKHHSEMAIVFDEFGVVSGLVTLEDVIEEIFGDVQDEFDTEEADINKVSDNEYIINAILRIDEINELLDLNLKEEEIETIGGLVLKKLGRIAKVGDKVNIENFVFSVESIEGTRITKLRIRK